MQFAPLDGTSGVKATTDPTTARVAVLGVLWVVAISFVFPWIASFIPVSLAQETRVVLGEIIPTTALAAILTATGSWNGSFGRLALSRRSLAQSSLALLV